ncbi:PREDICTED: zinc finger protein 860-like [Cyphomyrmex costatus]|uniref:zinc finger protein 860-like n=1 Tax=Cyphomyrmex costatus TaxID=456900 RepID=UPI0008521F7C|nr:PREDICTED: zinc finger protein 860-like [Cyphomyrmex costatus]
MGQRIKNESSQEKSEMYNHTLEIKSNSTIGNLIIKQKKKKEIYKKVYDENVGNITINTEKEKGKKSERTIYKCPICHATYFLLCRYKEHIVKHSDVHLCMICEKTFKCKSDMNNHMKIHSNVTYTCDLCGLISRVSFDAHIWRVQKRDFRRCEQCYVKGFMSNFNLEDHNYYKKSYLAAQKHVIYGIQKSALRQHRCNRCSKNFNSEITLRNHMSLHSEKFLCAKCGKMLASNQALQRHELTHTGERRYQCMLCSKTFARYAYVKIHKLIHTGEKPYKCDICQQYFTQRSSVTTHCRKRHSGINVPTLPDHHYCRSVDLN